MSSDQWHSTTALVLTAGTALALGATLGAALGSRDGQARLRHAKLRLMALLGLRRPGNSPGSPTSSMGAS
jgi:hypothetical protein